MVKIVLSDCHPLQRSLWHVCTLVISGRAFSQKLLHRLQKVFWDVACRNGQH